MCLLNGDVAGALPHTTDFGIEEIYDKTTDTVTYRSIPIIEIIREAIRNFGNELPHNIIINDIEDAGLELLEYRGDAPMYMFRDIDSQQFKNMTLNPNQSCYYYLPQYVSGEQYRAFIERYPDEIDSYVLIGDNLYQLVSTEPVLFAGKISDDNILYDNLVEQLDGASESTTIMLEKDNLNAKQYKIAKFMYGMTPGYRLTDLVYAGELICNVGETLTSMLDKIKNMLGNFEYFYNLDGKFVFQQKRNYVTSAWNQTEDAEGVKIDSSINNSSYAYSFVNSSLISSFSNNPNLLNLRNDYSIWGSSKRNGIEIPIHLRYAIDHKPEIYTTIPWYNSDGSIKKESKTYTSDEYDWRELIYQMALDYRQNYHRDDFLFEVSKYNNLCMNGKTGYEQYYIDLEGFWRDLYNPEPTMYYDIINYKDIPKHTDSLYIQHAYRKLKEEDITLNLDLKKVYILEKNQHTGEVELRPYLGSIYCRLNPEEEYFYISSNNSLDWSNEKDVLNQISLDKIYIKSRQNFNVQTGDEEYIEVFMDKDTFEPNKYYLKDPERGEFLLAANYYKNLQYYQKTVIPFNTRIENSEMLENYLVYINPKVKQSFAEMDKRDYTLYTYLYHPITLDDTVKKKLYIKDYNYTEFESFDTDIFNFYQLNAKDDSIVFNKPDDDGTIKIIKCPQTLKILQSDNYGLTYDIEENVNYSYGYYNYNHNEQKDGNYWVKTISDNPELLTFWFDFLESENNDMEKHSVPVVGSRTKVINDKDVKTIYYKEVPQTIFMSKDQINQHELQPGYTYIYLQNNMINLFTISSKGKSAKDKLDELLYTHSYCVESANIQALPVYHLQPNNKIYIKDDKSGIEGEYIVDKITIPLTYNGMMQITATKVVSSIT